MNVTQQMQQAIDALRAIVQSVPVCSTDEQMNKGECLSDQQVDLFDVLCDTIDELFLRLPVYEQDERKKT